VSQRGQHLTLALVATFTLGACQPASTADSTTTATTTAPSVRSVKPGQEFVGLWERRGQYISITPVEDTFLVIFYKSEYAAFAGNFEGTLTPVGLKVDLGMGGEQVFVHLKSDDSLSFGGDVYRRRQPNN
jgi:hypothetical protein